VLLAMPMPDESCKAI